MRDDDFLNFIRQPKLLDTDNRPLQLRLAHSAGMLEDVLLPQRVFGTAEICAGHCYEIWCVATDASIELKQLIALPVALDFVTDRGELNSVCGIVTEACAGDSDGGIATYKLVMRDALAVLEKRINTRIFRHQNEVEIVQFLISEWRQSNEVMANTFELAIDAAVMLSNYPQREFIMQYNESDAAFIRRLLARRGIGWYFRAGGKDVTDDAPSNQRAPVHTMVLFNSPDRLPQNRAGTVRYHRDSATEQRDTITSWAGIRSLQAGSVSLHSWDYQQPQGSFATADISSLAQQGVNGGELAASLNDYQILAPHSADNNDDLRQLGKLRMNRHDYEAKCYQGRGSVRDFRVGEYFSLTGHPEIDTHPANERDFVITRLQVTAQNNLPKGLVAKVERLFARNRWGHAQASWQSDAVNLAGAGPVRFDMSFCAVRLGIPVVPAYDARTDLPPMPMQSAIVVGPQGEEVYCDKLGRVKIRILGTRAADHAQAHGVGASGTDVDSAWVRVASNWAGNGPGSQVQCGALNLPRVGSEVLVAFLGGDPDKPIIVGQLYNGDGEPAALSERGELPGNRHLSGMKSREIKGARHNQLRFDDSSGRINAQLASDHGASQLNLGFLTQPLARGYGEARGEGVELRTDKAAAVRGGQGVLISAEASTPAKGMHMDRDGLIALFDALYSVVDELSKVAVSNAKDDASGPQLQQLRDRLKNLHDGSGAPIVATSGPAGMIAGSQQNMALGAETTVDIISGGDTRVSAGANVLLRAALDVSLLANKLGMKLIAASGKVQMQAQDDAMELLAKKVLEIMSTTDWINLKAKQGVRIYGGGSELEISAGGILGYTPGNNYFYAADHQTFPQQSKPAQFPEEIPHHDICIPCLLKSAGAHKSTATSQQ